MLGSFMIFAQRLAGDGAGRQVGADARCAAPD